MFLTVTESGSRGWQVPLPLTAMSPGPGRWQAPSKHLLYVRRGFPLASRVSSVPVLEEEEPTTHFYEEGNTSDRQEMLRVLLLAFGGLSVMVAGQLPSP